VGNEVLNRSVEGDVASFLLRAGKPDTIALQDARRTWTYADLANGVTLVATQLHEWGGESGDRAVLLADNSFFWVVSYLGILRAGLIAVPVSPIAPAEEVRAILTTTTPRFAFVDTRHRARHAHGLTGLSVLTERDVHSKSADTESTRNNLGDARRIASGLPHIEPHDLAALMFTSGSTSTPCGVMVSHKNIMANTMSIIECLRLTERDSVMAVLPFHYCFGTSLLHTHLRVGGTIVLESRFMYPEIVLNRLAESGCTGFAGVPSHYQILLRNSNLAARTFPSLRYVQQAGGYLSPALVDELRAALPTTQVFIMYGQTEATARLSCLAPEYLDAKRGSIGKGIPGVRLRVVDHTDADVLPGQVGEITAEGDNIAQGYWNDRPESEAHFRAGRLYTGDLATVDDEGFIYIVGREKDFLKCRGERTSCQAIEAQLLECEDLLEAAVIGMPDDVLGEAVRAFVVPRDPRPEGFVDRLREFCRQRMPAHLIPRDIVIVSELPKSNSGKVLKRELNR